MKAITLKQPWAHVIFDLELVEDLDTGVGRKNIENRTWSTEFRGPLAIVAGLGWDSSGPDIDPEELPYGQIVGVVDLVDVHEHLTERCDPNGVCKPVSLRGGWAEFRPFGLRTIQHWVLENPRDLTEHHVFPYTGFLGIRELGDSISKAIEQALDEDAALSESAMI